MTHVARRKKRLAQLIELAQSYRGWSRRELARALGRDPTKIIPGSGVPKLDLVVQLAAVLDWGVEDVVDFFWTRLEDEDTAEARQADFEAIDAEAREAHRQGRYGIMVRLARRAYETAVDPAQRARACNREAGGWDGLGRFQNALRAIQRGLQEQPVPGDYRRMLQSNLANAYYAVWSLVEARAIAGDLIEWYRHHAPESRRDRKTNAFAHYVAGHANRRLVGAEPDRADVLARTARHQLLLAEQMHLELAREFGEPALEGIAATCRGGLIEVEVTLGARPAGEALELLHHGATRPTDAQTTGDQLESMAWWCIFGCNLALRHLQDEAELQRWMALFTSRADELAERLDSWAIRERVFTMEHTRWERAVGVTGFDIPATVDRDDLRVIAGTMARFPSFRATGWRILRSAQLVEADDAAEGR